MSEINPFASSRFSNPLSDLARAADAAGNGDGIVTRQEINDLKDQVLGEAKARRIFPDRSRDQTAEPVRQASIAADSLGDANGRVSNKEFHGAFDQLLSDLDKFGKDGAAPVPGKLRC